MWRWNVSKFFSSSKNCWYCCSYFMRMWAIRKCAYEYIPTCIYGTRKNEWFSIYSYQSWQEYRYYSTITNIFKKATYFTIYQHLFSITIYQRLFSVDNFGSFTLLRITRFKISWKFKNIVLKMPLSTMLWLVFDQLEFVCHPMERYIRKPIKHLK